MILSRFSPDAFRNDWAQFRSPDGDWRQRAKGAIRILAKVWVLCILLFILYTVLLIPFTPSVKNAAQGKAERPSTLISADGKPLANYRRVNRKWVSVDRIS